MVGTQRDTEKLLHASSTTIEDQDIESGVNTTVVGSISTIVGSIETEEEEEERITSQDRMLPSKSDGSTPAVVTNSGIKNRASFGSTNMPSNSNGKVNSNSKVEPLEGSSVNDSGNTPKATAYGNRPNNAFAESIDIGPSSSSSNDAYPDAVPEYYTRNPTRTDEEVILDFIDNNCSQCTPVCRPLKRYLNKGDLSNFFTFGLMMFGFFLNYIGYYENEEERKSNYILAFGLFGFAGGFTNWVAIQMLFDEICGLPGSGVIPNRFKEIRVVVKSTIMRAFFDREFLNSYLKDRIPGMIKSYKPVMSGKLEEYLGTADFDRNLIEKLEKISTTPEGAMLQMMKGMFGGSFDGLVPMIKPTISSLGKEMLDGADKMDLSSIVSIEQVQHEIDLLMTEKLELLTPQLVKQLVEEMIRKHLGWLVVWGNVFGGMIGVVSMATAVY